MADVNHVIQAAIEYLSERADALEHRISVLEGRELQEDADELLLEYCRVDDILRGLSRTESTRRATRRSGTRDRLMPLVRQLMADGQRRTLRQILNELEEPEVSASAVNHILASDYLEYRRVETRPDVWEAWGPGIGRDR